MRACEVCGSELPTIARRHARTCSTRCRVALHRRRQHEVPAELAQRGRWVRRSADKVPLQANGRNASCTAPRTWSTYQQATGSSAGVGLGFVLNGDGVVCVDLDHCIAPDGTVAAWAQSILDRASGTYVEVSASGTGLHVWGRAVVDRARVVRDGERAIEVYGSGRYIAMGRRYRDAPLVLGDLSPLLAAL